MRWFVYLNAPVSRLAAVIDLGSAIVDAPERIAAIAEAARPGNGASVLEYVRDLERAFAIPILSRHGVSGPAGRPSCGLSWVIFTRRRGMCGSAQHGSCWRRARRWPHPLPRSGR